MTDTLTIALAGNPNSGKTTIFNALTGAHQHVGNYPGVTVEKKHGVCHHKGVRIDVVDLPGTYSLTAYSVEELVARNFIIDSILTWWSTLSMRQRRGSTNPPGDTAYRTGCAAGAGLQHE